MFSIENFNSIKDMDNISKIKGLEIFLWKMCFKIIFLLVLCLFGLYLFMEMFILYGWRYKWMIVDVKRMSYIINVCKVDDEEIIDKLMVRIRWWKSMKIL